MATPFRIRWTMVYLAVGLASCSPRAHRIGTIHGTVTDRVGTPLANAHVALSSATDTIPVTEILATSTDGMGRFTLSTIPAGRYSVWASFIGYITRGEAVSLTGDSAFVIVEMEATPFKMHFFNVPVEITPVVIPQKDSSR